MCGTTCVAVDCYMAYIFSTFIISFCLPFKTFSKGFWAEFWASDRALPRQKVQRDFVAKIIFFILLTLTIMPVTCVSHGVYPTPRLVVVTASATDTACCSRNRPGLLYYNLAQKSVLLIIPAFHHITP